MALSDICTPDYKENLEEWEEYQLLLAGGKELLAKMPKVSAEESDANFKLRVDGGADKVNLAQSLQSQEDILSLAGISYEIKNDTIAEMMQMPVTHDGKSLMQFIINDALHQALAYGKAFIVVDRNPIIDGLTRAEAEILNSPPYAYTVPPVSVPATMYDAGGQLEGLIVKSKMIDPSVEMNGYRTETMQVWSDWRSGTIVTQNEKGEVLQSVETQIDVLPVIEWKLNQSFFKNLYGPTIQCLQHWSMASTGGQKAIFGLPVVFSNQKLKQMDVGTGKGLQLNKDDKFEVHNTSAEIIKANEELSEKDQAFINFQLHQRIEEGASVYSSSKASGVSKARDKDSQEAFSAYLGTEIAQMLPRVVGLFGKYMGIDEVETVVTLPEKWVIQDPAEDREKAKAVSLDYSPQTEGQFVAAEKIKRKYFGLEDVMTADAISQDDEDLEKMAPSRMGEVDIVTDSLSGDTEQDGDL